MPQGSPLQINQDGRYGRGSDGQFNKIWYNNWWSCTGRGRLRNRRISIMTKIAVRLPNLKKNIQKITKDKLTER